MIIYRKAAHLRVRRVSAPEPPFWCATAIAPYSQRRLTPVSIDYIDLRATATERAEVTVCESPEAELGRVEIRHHLDEPILVESADFAEEVFRRGEQLVKLLKQRGSAAVQLVSTRGAVPAADHGATVVIAAWPLEFHRLERLFATAREHGLSWGVGVPVIYPVTTNLVALEELADLAAKHGSRFFASIAVEPDPTAKQAIARSLVADDEDDEEYAQLFHADLEPIHTSTERHVAALAHERGMLDSIPPADGDAQTNWNAAILLTITASRMLAMEDNVELAGTLARSARLVATLEKPLVRVAEAATLGIIEALDEVSVDLLTEWLETGRSSFAERVNAQWRLRRDHGARGGEELDEA